LEVYKMLKKFALVLLVCLAITSLFACRGDYNTISNSGEKLKVLVTFNAMAEFAKAVGGDKVEVSTIIPDGASIHDFEPKAQDMAKISKADVFIYNGLGADPWAENVIKASSNDNLIVVDASFGASIIEHTEDDEHDHGHGGSDPHLWLGIKGARAQAENIKNAFALADSENASFYEQNFSEFAAQLDGLYNEFKEKFDSLEKKNFVTGHAAFGYLCHDFGLEQKSVMDIYAEGEPSARQLARLVEYCRDNNVTTIFAEEMASPQVSKTLAEEVGARVETIYTIESSENGKTYLERMQENLSKIYESML
jgi:zinc transport system substrate-binding protein